MADKKIISFSLWGDRPKYVQGALENLALQKIHYPDRHTDRTMKIFVNKVDVRKIKINDTIKVAQSE